MPAQQEHDSMPIQDEQLGEQEPQSHPSRSLEETRDGLMLLDL